jgi:hypothetical protein
MKERREAQRAKSPGSRKKNGASRNLPPVANGRGPGTKVRTKAGRLIAFEDLRPLPPGGPLKKRKKCPDCRYCQGCSQDRCRLCRTKKKPGPGKLTVAEQIALYEKINRPKGKKPAPGTGVGPKS